MALLEFSLEVKNEVGDEVVFDFNEKNTFFIEGECFVSLNVTERESHENS